MDCAVIQIELAPYHLATCDEEARARIDAHLLECTECLRAYLAIKRHLEGAGDRLEGRECGRATCTPAEHARPSDVTRARLRAAVASAFRPTLVTRAARALRRPVPLYQSLAAAAAIVLLVSAVAPLLARQAPEPAPTASGMRVDTARPTPENLSFY